MRPRNRQSRPRFTVSDRRRAGFTLIEAALATVIVGTGVVSAMALFAVCSDQNRHASRLTVGAMLASNVEEAMAGLPFDDPFTGSSTFGPETGESLTSYDDLDDFNGLDTSLLAGPIDAMRQPMPQLNAYAQVITVERVQENNPNIAATGSNAARVRVRIVWRRTPDGEPVDVHSTSWLRTR